MTTKNKTVLTQDLANGKAKVVREFAAPLKKVWDYWTKSDLLDQWWAPQPWKAVTEKMDFREGGFWHYYMAGPDGEKNWCIVDYFKIDPLKSITSDDAFCDEKKNINREFPVMHWNKKFTESAAGTRVEVELTFDSPGDLKKILEMGFEQGFAMAHDNLDELLDK